MEVQFEVVHESVDEAFATMLVGLAVNALMVHGEPTVTVAVAVGLFVPSVEVSVYVVVVTGLTVVLPEEFTLPIPGSISDCNTLQFADEAHVRVEELPDVIVVGLAVNDVIVQAAVTGKE